MWLALAVVTVVRFLAHVPTICHSMWETADRQIARLNPAAFPELPRRRCW
jgi:hypothetical protein